MEGVRGFFSFILPEFSFHGGGEVHNKKYLS
jgi:hypothetical protein